MRGRLKDKWTVLQTLGSYTVALRGHGLHLQMTPSHIQDHPTVVSDGMISPASSMAENVISKKAHPMGKVAMGLYGPHCGNWRAENSSFMA